MRSHVGDRPIDDNYVALGWSEVGDLTKIPPNREALKEAITATYPDKKPGAVAGRSLPAMIKIFRLIGIWPEIPFIDGQAAVKLMRTRISFLAQPKSMRSIIDATQREQWHGSA